MDGNETETTATNDATIPDGVIGTTKFGKSGSSAGALLAMNKVAAASDAYIGNPASGTTDTSNVQGTSISVTSNDTATITASSSIVDETATTDTITAFTGFIEQLIPTFQYTTESGTQTINNGDMVYVPTHSGDPTDGGNVGGVYQYIGQQPLTDVDLANLGADGFSNTSLWSQPISASNFFNLAGDIGNITDSNARAVGGDIVYNEVIGSANSIIYGGVTLNATAGNIAITATEAAQITPRRPATSRVRAAARSAAVRCWRRTGRQPLTSCSLTLKPKPRMQR